MNKFEMPLIAAIFVACGFGCGGEEPEAPAKPTICAKAALTKGFGEEQTVGKAQFTVNGAAFTGCVNVQISIDNVIQASNVEGLVLETAPAVFPANSLEPGQKVDLVFVYRDDVRILRILAKNRFERIVANAPILIDGSLYGVGEVRFEYKTDKRHTVSFGRLAKYSRKPRDLVLTGQEFPNDEVIAYYEGDNLAEACFRVVNDETGDELDNANVRVNEQEVRKDSETGLHCEVQDTNDNLRVTYTGYYGGVIMEDPFKIPAGTLLPGESRTFTLNLLEAVNEGIDRLCVDTTGFPGTPGGSYRSVLGEITLEYFDGRTRSIGWPLSDEIACAQVKVDRVARIKFERLPGREDAAGVEFASLKRNQNGQLNSVVGWYDRSRTRLDCVTTKGPYGGTIEAEYIRHDTIRMKGPYHLTTCLASIPALEHRVECGPARYERSLGAPPVITLPANNMQTGTRLDIECLYNESNKPNTYRNVRVVIRNEFNSEQMARFVVIGRNNGEVQRSTEVHWSGETEEMMSEMMQREPQPAQPQNFIVDFLDEPYLVPPPRFSLTLEQLRNLSTNDANYDREKNLWTFEVMYRNAGPSIYFCARGMTNEGLEISNTFAWFNTLEPSNPNRDAGRNYPCRVIPVNTDLTLAFGWWQQGYRNPYPMFFPAGSFARLAGRSFIYAGVFVPENVAADLAIGTIGGQGEVTIRDDVLSGRSIGYSASTSGQTDVRVVVDIRRQNSVMFGAVNGVVPPQVRFNPNDPSSPDGPGTLRWQSSTQVVGCYLQTCPTPAQR